MDSNGFLKELLLKFDIEKISNLGFGDVGENILKSIDSIDDKRIVVLSSTKLSENMHIIASLKHKNYLKSIISLPVYHKDDNLVMLIFNPLKTDNNCLYIDESDSLIHKSDSVDWSYAGEELIARIIKTYDDFSETDNAVLLDFGDIFEGSSRKNVHDELLSLKSTQVDDSVRKNRVMGRDVNDELLSIQFDSSSPKKNKVIKNDLADGLLSLKQQQSVREEISKADVKSVDVAQNTTLPFLNEAMYYKRRQNPKNLLYKNEKPLFDVDVPFRKLGKICDLENIYVKNDKDSILVATCKGCKSKLVYYNRNIADFEGEVYIELTNIHESVSPDYLYEYLNSSNGFDELLYFSKGNTHITPEEIKHVKVPIPPLEIQKEIVKVSRESREFFKTVDLLKKEFNSNILDYRPMQKSLNEFGSDIAFNDKNDVTSLSRSWRHAYNGMIWPLAISYLSATKGGFETVEKKDNYLVLFEFIAAFNAVVLLSGLPDDVYRRNFKKIWNKNLGMYHQMTFANWVYLSMNISNVYKSNNFTSQLDEELFDIIGGDNVLNILENVKDLRNKDAHGSHTNSYEAKELIEKLDVYLDDVFDMLDIYSNYKLIYVTGNISSAKQAYSHRVILLNGPCAQPIYDDIIFDTPLQKECLYLYNPKNNKKLLLKDNFIKFKAIDKNKKHWRLFIYYSCDRDEYNAFYKCFQSNEKDVKISISSLKEDVLGKKF
ncbi:restriction endonuclease subunit S [Methanobrevibacter sp. UBA212]|uniref:restriction endonuclease subunit S n=1 Tax=Methanobrevibacter sp. UBA212 TaxID=1915476 RepID=UPI0025D3EA01|nr:restriction endonuclease subunit S [Methanobrevibacter sp. UBA212]